MRRRRCAVGYRDLKVTESLYRQHVERHSGDVEKRRPIDHRVQLWGLATPGLLGGIGVLPRERRPRRHPMHTEPHVHQHVLHGRILKQQQGENEGRQQPVTERFQGVCAQVPQRFFCMNLPVICAPRCALSRA